MPYNESVYKLGVPIAPTEPEDVNPTHIAEYGRGGLMSVATLAARDAIPAGRKTVGMLVYVSAESKYYTLTTLPSTWVELQTGGSPSIPDPLTIVELNAERIDFDTTPADPTTDTGRMVWNTDYRTVMLGMNGVVVPLGQSMMKLAHNATGQPIAKGSVVYIAGSHANTSLLIDLADANSESMSSKTIGLAAETIANGDDGFIITEGLLSGLTTNGLSGSSGTAIWLSETAGEFTSTKPSAPNHGVFLGWLVKKAGSGAGSVFVKIINYPELDELHDVLITSIANDDALIWDSGAGVWRNEKIGLSSLASINAAKLIGRRSGTSGTPEEITVSTGLKISSTGVLTTDAVPSDTRSINAGTGLTGGGDLSADRTFSVDFAASGESSTTKAVRADDSRLSDARPALGSASTALSADVTMTNADTWYDGPSVSLSAGTWVIDSMVTILKANVTGTDALAVRITDGTNHYSSGNQSWNTRLQALTTMSCSSIVTLGSTTTIKIQAASQYAGCTIKAATTYQASGNTASNINAVRIA
jgi:hypothetical protein